MAAYRGDAPGDLTDELHAAVRRAHFKQAVRVRGMEHEQRVTASELAATADRFSLGLREVQVLALIAEGHTNAEIGAALYISEETVKSHLRNITK